MSHPLLYQGSVKDLRGPVSFGSDTCVVFDYTDAYSVFDWGRMPDLLPHKGEALATLAGCWFERLEKPETWQAFSKSPAALQLRKANRFGAAFNEVGESLQKSGLKTHYRGVLSGTGRPTSVSQVAAPVKQFAVQQVTAVRPSPENILGRTVPNYIPTRSSPAPRLVPLEVIFRFACPEGSSLIERTSRDPGYLASIGFGDYQVQAGQKWAFPVLEVFTKLESSDRPLTLSEGLAISGLSGAQLQDVLFKTAWTAGLIKWICEEAGLELADGKLEWGISAQGEIFLVDAIGPDELRILTKSGIQLSKEFLRLHYRRTSWFEATQKAKKEAKARGASDWKQLCSEQPQHLPASQKELASHLYMALTNTLSGKKWFQEAWSLNEVIERLNALVGGSG